MRRRWGTCAVLFSLLREARLTYGLTLFAPVAVGLAVAAWVVKSGEQSAEHAAMAVPLLEAAVAPIFAIVGARLFAHDITLGVVEAVAVRGIGYSHRNIVRLAILVMLAVLALAVPTAEVSEVLKARPLLLFVIWLPPALILGGAGAYLAAFLQSEAAGAAIAIVWWLGDMVLGRGLAHAGPWSWLSLIAFMAGNPDWVSVKIGQSLAFVVLAALLIASSPRLVQMALVKSSG
jgi:hypothetical protein